MLRNAQHGEIRRVSRDVARLVVEMSYRAKVGHIGSALSICDLVSALYFYKLNISPSLVGDPRRDRFILSKGHAAAALYAVLCKKGILTLDRINTFATHIAGLCEHPALPTPGIELSTGSLGHGLGVGVGLAYGLHRIRNAAAVYVLISDGECGEGSIWEAAMLAPHLRLDNLIVIIDYNNWQCFGRSNEITMLQPLSNKWRSFGWVTEEIDGHSITEIARALDRAPRSDGKPTAIIAHTIAGKGISCIQDQQAAHYKVLSEDEYKQALDELMSVQ